LIAENNADKLIYHSEEPQLIEKLNSGTHIAEVVAVYENNKTSVRIAKVFKGTWVNVEENIATNNINVYPNPVNDRLYIETLTLTQTQTLTIEIYDVYGRLQDYKTTRLQGNVAIDVADLKSGIYFVKVNTEKGNIVKRIIKQ
jgi:tRNA(Ile2) C34 agmatinyltransferase TiaS